LISLFTWNDTFLTRLEPVDRQHQQLVELINDLSELVVSSEDLDMARFQAIRDGLLSYVAQHFAEEEQLMAEARVDGRHLEKHQAIHASFVREATSLHDVAGPADIGRARQLADYLVHWLAYHILDRDQCMARQVQAIRGGMSPEDAYAQEDHLESTRSEPLLKAMSGLFMMVSERNRELRALNEALEARVATRTRELEETNERLERLSTHDELTGLANRRFANLSLAQLWGQRARHGDALSVLMLDADHFKAVNDTWGHALGDALIVEVGRRLKASVRSSDIVCRMGGDEFLVICPRNAREGARKVAEKILAASLPFHTGTGEVCWSGALSIGLAEAADGMEGPEALLRAADRAMYDAKRQGGHRIAE